MLALQRSLRFKALLLGDLQFQKIYGILPVYMFVTLVYLLLLWFLPTPDRSGLVVMFMFTDPMFLGMLFITVLLYFEKSERVLDALVVSPITPAMYLWAKALSLCLISIFMAVLLAIIPYAWKEGRWTEIRWGWLILSVSVSSLGSSFFAFGLGARFSTFNQYMLGLLAVTMIILLPTLAYFGIIESVFWYAVPSYAGLILIDSSFHIRTTGEIVYAICYLIGFGCASYFWALHCFKKYIIQQRSWRDQTHE